jgi:hypothetical protein
MSPVMKLPGMYPSPWPANTAPASKTKTPITPPRVFTSRITEPGYALIPKD